MLGTFNEVGIFLLNSIFDLYLLVLMLRLILCWARSDYFNPITHFIIKCTQFIISPLRRMLPTYKGIELSTLFLILLLGSLKFFLIGLILVGLPQNIFGIFMLACVDSLKLLLNIFFYAILLQAILSFIQQGYSSLSVILTQITSPILRPIQRLLPVVGGFDLSPIPALILIQVLIILITPLITLASNIAFGGYA